MKPTVGRVVLFVIGATEIEAIKKQWLIKPEGTPIRKAGEAPGTPQYRSGNFPEEGTILSADVVAVWSDTCVNLKVKLDGPGSLWLTSRSLDQEGKAPGTWHWMDYQIKQAELAKSGGEIASPRDQLPTGAASTVAGWGNEDVKGNHPGGPVPDTGRVGQAIGGDVPANGPVPEQLPSVPDKLPDQQG